MALQQRWAVPEASLPARPWEPSEQQARLLPETAEFWFDPTAVWRVELAFSPTEWDGLGPTYVPPPPKDSFQNGFPLRNPNAYRSGLAGVLGFHFPWSKGTVSVHGERLEEVGIRFRGNGTFMNSLFGNKRSFKLDLNRHRKGQRLAGLRGVNLNNLIEDYSCLSDTLAYELFRNFGVPEPRTTFVWLSVAGMEGTGLTPLGLYVAVEKVDKVFVKDRFGTKKIPIFKPVTRELFSYLGSDWDAYAGIYDLKTEATAQQKEHLLPMPNRWRTRALSSPGSGRTGFWSVSWVWNGFRKCIETS